MPFCALPLALTVTMLEDWPNGRSRECGFSATAVADRQVWADTGVVYGGDAQGGQPTFAALWTNGSGVQETDSRADDPDGRQAEEADGRRVALMMRDGAEKGYYRIKPFYCIRALRRVKNSQWRKSTFSWFPVRQAADRNGFLHFRFRVASYNREEAAH